MNKIISNNTLNLDKYSTIEYLNMISSDDFNDELIFDDQEHIRLIINNRTNTWLHNRFNLGLRRTLRAWV